jgi:hypothetical protein
MYAGRERSDVSHEDSDRPLAVVNDPNLAVASANPNESIILEPTHQARIIKRSESYSSSETSNKNEGAKRFKTDRSSSPSL